MRTYSPFEQSKIQCKTNSSKPLLRVKRKSYLNLPISMLYLLLRYYAVISS